MTERELVISKEKHQELKKELNFLKTTKRSEIAARIQEAKEYGDISENSDYDDAKNQQAFVEGKIAEIEETLKKAKILDGNGPKGTISPGSKISLKDQDKNVIEYLIVGPLESDPASGKISLESPLGQALANKKKGDKITVKLPSGTLDFEILKVE